MILRGTFDCLVQRRDGGMTVLELKTGKPAPEHEQQLSMYLTAARALFPGTAVEGKLVYARQLESGPSATRPEALTNFSTLLRANGITGLADVRTIPKSRRHPHFGTRGARRAPARRKASSIVISPRSADCASRAPDSPNGAWRNDAFRGYADHMMTPAFATRRRRAAGVSADIGHVAVMCAEAVWWQCHRMLLSDALVARDVDVQHIMSLRGKPR